MKKRFIRLDLEEIQYGKYSGDKIKIIINTQELILNTIKNIFFQDANIKYLLLLQTEDVDTDLFEIEKQDNTGFLIIRSSAHNGTAISFSNKFIRGKILSKNVYIAEFVNKKSYTKIFDCSIVSKESLTEEHLSEIFERVTHRIKFYEDYELTNFISTTNVNADRIFPKLIEIRIANLKAEVLSNSKIVDSAKENLEKSQARLDNYIASLSDEEKLYYELIKRTE